MRVFLDQDKHKSPSEGEIKFNWIKKIQKPKFWELLKDLFSAKEALANIPSILQPSKGQLESKKISKT